MAESIFKLTEEQQARFDELIHPYKNSAQIQRMRAYTAHGRISVFVHVMRVARLSFWLNHKYGFGADDAELIRGAVLHDYYLYDWHDEDGGTHKLHGFTHPLTACANAEKEYALSEKERNIITSHMWPLTLTRLPLYRESWIVCLADKICSSAETVRYRH